jgi:hypothetical protein
MVGFGRNPSWPDRANFKLPARKNLGNLTKFSVTAKSGIKHFPNIFLKSYSHTV